MTWLLGLLPVPADFMANAQPKDDFCWLFTRMLYSVLYQHGFMRKTIEAVVLYEC